MVKYSFMLMFYHKLSHQAASNQYQSPIKALKKTQKNRHMAGSLLNKTCKKQGIRYYLLCTTS